MIFELNIIINIEFCLHNYLHLDCDLFTTRHFTKTNLKFFPFMELSNEIKKTFMYDLRYHLAKQVISFYCSSLGNESQHISQIR